MNKLLRNPWVVTALVIGMGALWWVQMRDIFFPGGGASAAPAQVTVANGTTSAGTSNDTSTSTSASSAADNSSEVGADAVAIEPLSSVRAIAPTQLRADTVPTRDPFGPLTVAAPLETPPAVTEVPAETVALDTVEAMPALEAVLNTPSAHIAVIDGRIVRVGDKVSGRAVLRIDNASVALGGGPESPTPLVLKLPAR